MKVKSNSEGVCPKCNGTNLNYGSIEMEGNMMYYPWECEDCSQSGEEWYDLIFAGHNLCDEYGTTTVIEPHMIERGDE